MSSRKMLVPVACLQCGTVFNPERSSRRFCSRTCGAQWRLAHGTLPRRKKEPDKHATGMCPVCGKEFEYLLSFPLRTCSRKCGATARGMGLPGFSTKRRAKELDKHATTICPACGKEFEYLLSWPRKYCSNACAGLGTGPTNLPHFGNGYDATCEVCGKVFRANKTVRGRFCSMRCWGNWLSANIRGELSPGWRGGYEPYYGPSWPSAQRAVRARDKVCQGCGMTPEQNGKALDVHHLKPFRTFGRERHAEANDLSNLVALCPACHKKWEASGWLTEGKPAS